jgi:hypothetical protein
LYSYLEFKAKRLCGEATTRGAAHDVIGRRIVSHVVGGLGIYVCAFGDRWRVGGRAAQLLAQGGQPLPETRAEEAVVAHFDEDIGQDVLQKAADELLSGKGAGSTTNDPPRTK